MDPAIKATITEKNIIMTVQIKKMRCMSTYYSRGKYKYERNAACRVVNYLSHVENRWLYKSIDIINKPKAKLTLINKKNELLHTLLPGC